MTRTPISGHRTAVLAAILVLTRTAAATASPTPYYNEVVSLNDGCYPDVVVDGHGNLFAVSTARVFAFHARVDGRWSHMAIDATQGAGVCNGIALGSDGRVRVAWMTYNPLATQTNSIRYGVVSGGRVEFEQLPVLPDSITGNSQELELGLGPGDVPHLAFLNFNGHLCRYAVKTGSGWTIETVGRAQDQGIGLAVDPQGIPRIVTTDANTGVTYFERVGGAWRGESISPRTEALENSVSPVATFADIVVGPSNSLHVSWHHIASGSDRDTLYYSSRTAGGWVNEYVDSGPHGSNLGTLSGIAVDASGLPHITYTDLLGSDLKHAIRSSSGWTKEFVDVPSAVSESNAALDPEGNIHILYFDSNANELLHATNGISLTTPLADVMWASGSARTLAWQGVGPVDVEFSSDGGRTYQVLASGIADNLVDVIAPAVETDNARIRLVRTSPFASTTSERFSVGRGLAVPYWNATVATTNDVGQFVSLALDAQGRPAMSYYESTQFDLKYAYRAGPDWKVETIQSSGFVGQYSSLKFDASGVAHVAYQDQNNFTLRYATRTGPNSWSVEAVVDSGNGVDQHCSLAFDRFGNPAIGYVDGGNFKPKYAIRTGGTWVKETLPDANSGKYISLAFDQSNVPQMTYLDSFNSDLRYAIRRGGAWTSELVDSAGIVGQFSSLAILPSGQPCVAYYDATKQDVRFGTRAVDGTWTTTVVDSVGAVGRGASLCLTPAGDPVIAYIDSTAGTIKGARQVDDVWSIVTIDQTPGVAAFASARMDADGNLRVAYYDQVNGDLRYASAALECVTPGPGASWPAGARREIRWAGPGAVDVALSTDGGTTYQTLATAVDGGKYNLTVPNTPSSYCRIRLERSLPVSSAFSDSAFVITSGGTLLTFDAREQGGGDGVQLEWRSDPGPEDLSGYQLERMDGAAWRRLRDGIQVTSYFDPDGRSGSRYRLTAVDRLGNAFVLGETSVDLGVPLAAWPSPYRSGVLNVVFMADGQRDDVQIALFDVNGRRIRDLGHGRFPPGANQLVWDGRDRSGQTVRAGLYFIRTLNAGRDAVLRVPVISVNVPAASGR